MNRGNVLVIVAVLLGVGFLGSFYLKSNSKTDLKLNNNDSQTESVKSEKMTLSVSGDATGLIKGTTTAFAEIFINDKETKADAKGNFSIKMPLDLGENIFIVSANNSEGDVVEETLTINYEEN